MFRLLNLRSDKSLTIEVSHNNETLSFIIGTIVSKRDKEYLDDRYQFALLNAYCEYKGRAFKDKLFGLYKNSDDGIMMSLTSTNIYPLPYEIVHPIIDIFDLKDIYHFVSVIYGVKPPSILKDTFDELYEKDGHGSRVQTYLKTDYLELASLVVIIKAVIGPIGQYGYVKNASINPIHKEYVLYNFISTHKISKIPAVEKLLGSIEKLMDMPDVGKGESESIRILEKQIPKSEMSNFILAIVMIQRVALANIVQDNDDKNLVTKIYNYVKNKLKINSDANKSIRNVSAIGDNDGKDEKESYLESYRLSSEVTIGDQVEFQVSADDIMVMIPQMPDIVNENGEVIPLDMSIIKDALDFNRVFLNGEIDKNKEYILGILLKTIGDPRSIKYFNAHNMVNSLSLSFAYLWALGYKHIALLLTSKIDRTKEDVLSIKMTVNRNRIPAHVKVELHSLFP